MYSNKYLSLVAIAVIVSTPIMVLAQNQIEISLFATDLFDCDAISACDTVVTIFCASNSAPNYVKCGETDEHQDDAYPIFPERFLFSHTPGAGEKWRFNLVDKDVAIDDPIGTVFIDSVDSFVSSVAPNNAQALPIPNNRGTLHVKRER